MKYFILIFAFLFLSCSQTTTIFPYKDMLEKKQTTIIKPPVAQKPKLAIQKPNIAKAIPQSHDYERYYHGNIKTTNGKMVTIFLKLVSKNGLKGYYLYQNDGEVKENRGIFNSIDKSTIKLQNGTLLYKGEDFIAFISHINQSPDNDKILEKLHLFKDKKRELLVDSISVIDGSVKGHNAVKFDGILNIDKKGSLKATYVVDCDEQSYAISKTSYFKDKFATGKIVDIVKNSEGVFFDFDNTNDVLYQAYKKYCKKK